MEDPAPYNGGLPLPAPPIAAAEPAAGTGSNAQVPQLPPLSEMERTKCETLRAQKANLTPDRQTRAGAPGSAAVEGLG